MRAPRLWTAWLLLVALSCRTNPQDETASTRELAFEVDGKQMVVLSIEQLADLDEESVVAVHEPYEQSEASFIAISLPTVLDRAYGPIWRTREELVFTCLDGYAPTIPVRRVLEHQAWLAIDRVGDHGFTILKFEEGRKKRVPLAPFYVIWDSLDDPQVRAEADYGWPYQVTTINLTSFKAQFARMAPPSNAGEAARAGFAAFRVHCIQCHSINGQGGKVGPELNYPANPTEYMRPEWLRKWIGDPASVRWAPRMPALNPELPDRQRVIEDLVAYLRAMSGHRLAPRGQRP